MVLPSSEPLSLVNAIKQEHFSAMSRLHTLGWRDTYVGYVPQDYLDWEITDERWTKVFQRDFEAGSCHGLLLYRGTTPVSCINHGRARTGSAQASSICAFDNTGYDSWGEIVSLYTHPAEQSKGYGGLLMEQALSQLRAFSHQNVFLFVLRENERARSFCSANGFEWGGTCAEIPFPPHNICVDLRYVRRL